MHSDRNGVAACAFDQISHMISDLTHVALCLMHIARSQGFVPAAGLSRDKIPGGIQSDMLCALFTFALSKQLMQSSSTVELLAMRMRVIGLFIHVH